MHRMDPASFLNQMLNITSEPKAPEIRQIAEMQKSG